MGRIVKRIKKKFKFTDIEANKKKKHLPEQVNAFFILSR